MRTTITNLRPRAVLALLRRRAVIAKPGSGHAAATKPAVKPDCGGAILSYDNVY